MHVIAAKGGNLSFWERIWYRLDQHPVAALILLYFLCIAVFVGTIPLPRIDGQLTGSDGAFYYSFLPTLLLDHDLDFTNQYVLLLPPEAIARQPLTAEGRPGNRHAVGPAILWAPFFLVGHFVALGLKAFGYPVGTDGMGYVYQVPTLLGSITYGFAGIVLVYRSCRRFYNSASSASAAILIWLATNLIYYMIGEPSMSHACSFFAAALFMNLWVAYRPDPSLGQWVLLGISGGLIALVRQPDAAWLALPVVDCLLAMKTDWRARLPRFLKGVLAFVLTATVTFIPQMAMWHMLQGSIFQSGYLQASGSRGSISPFHWLSPHPLSVLFSLKHGLFSWHPVLLLSLVGLTLVYRKQRSLTLAFALVSAAQLYIVSCWFGWSGGDSFGSRMLITLLPILALGFAAVIEWAASRRVFIALFTVAAACLLWNGLFIVQYRLGYISRIGTITFSQLTVGKVTMLKDLPARLRSMF